MITEVHLKNFQAHKDLRIKFTPGVNIIRGSSDAGKSAIIRAMLAVITGKEFNASYQTWGTSGSMEVTIKTEEHEVTRGRDSRRNFYRVDGKEYTALRGAVPREVEVILPVNASRDSDNLGTQYASFYLLSNSAGDVARKIQAVCDLDCISRASKEVSACIREASDNERVLGRELDNVGTELQRLDDVHIFRKRFTRLHERYLYLEEQKAQREKYEEISERYRALQGYENFALCASLRPEYEKCKEGFRELEKRKAEADSLGKTLRVCRRLDAESSRIAEVSRPLSAYKLQFDILEKEVLALRVKKIDRSALKKLLRELKEVDKSLQEEAENLSNLREEEVKLKKTLKLCPLCGHKL